MSLPEDRTNSPVPRIFQISILFPEDQFSLIIPIRQTWFPFDLDCRLVKRKQANNAANRLLLLSRDNPSPGKKPVLPPRLQMMSAGGMTQTPRNISTTPFLSCLPSSVTFFCDPSPTTGAKHCQSICDKNGNDRVHTIFQILTTWCSRSCR